MNRHFRNRRVSCANPEVGSIRRRSVRKTLAKAGLVRDNALIVHMGTRVRLVRFADLSGLTEIQGRFKGQAMPFAAIPDAG
jgi:hypothetical protein